MWGIRAGQSSRRAVCYKGYGIGGVPRRRDQTVLAGPRQWSIASAQTGCVKRPTGGVTPGAAFADRDNRLRRLGKEPREGSLRARRARGGGRREPRAARGRGGAVRLPLDGPRRADLR